MRDISPDSEPTWPIVLSLTQAADRLSVSFHYFCEHVLPNLLTISCGGRQLVPLAELDAWRNGAAGSDDGSTDV